MTSACFDLLILLSAYVCFAPWALVFSYLLIQSHDGTKIINLIVETNRATYRHLVGLGLVHTSVEWQRDRREVIAHQLEFP